MGSEKNASAPSLSRDNQRSQQVVQNEFDKLSKSHHFENVNSKTHIVNKQPNSGSSTSLKLEYEGDAQQFLETTNNISDKDLLPLLKYLSLNDSVTQEHRRLLSIFSKLLMMTSLVAIIYGLWIEVGTPTTFTVQLLKRTTLPLHYCIIVNGISGLICSGAFIGVMCIDYSRPFTYEIIVSIVSTLVGTVMLIYNYGCNVLYASEIEDLMIESFFLDKKARSEGFHWKTSQTFFKCCGINTYSNWDPTYPISCCSIDNCQQSLKKDQVWHRGCLEAETNSILSLSYSSLVIAITHFLMLTFTLMSSVKIKCRQSYIRSKTELILVTEEFIEENVNYGKTETVFESPKKVENTLSGITTPNSHKIKKSSTV